MDSMNADGQKVVWTEERPPQGQDWRACEFSWLNCRLYFLLACYMLTLKVYLWCRLLFMPRPSRTTTMKNIFISIFPSKSAHRGNSYSNFQLAVHSNSTAVNTAGHYMYVAEVRCCNNKQNTSIEISIEPGWNYSISQDQMFLWISIFEQWQRPKCGLTHRWGNPCF